MRIVRLGFVIICKLILVFKHYLFVSFLILDMKLEFNNINTIYGSKIPLSQPSFSSIQSESVNVTDLSKVPHYKPSFSGALNRNLKIGRDMIKEFGEEFPMIKSNTKVGAFIDKHEFEPRYRMINKQLKSLEKKYSKGVGEMRDSIEDYMDFEDFDGFARYNNKQIESVKKSGYANCQDCAEITQWKLLQKGHDVHNVLFNIKNPYSGMDKVRGSHVFNVIGLNKKATLDDPSTWGHSAVVVDPLFKTVMPAREALPVYEKMFGFDPDMYELEYYSQNLLPDKEISEIASKFKNSLNTESI